MLSPQAFLCDRTEAVLNEHAADQAGALLESFVVDADHFAADLRSFVLTSIARADLQAIRSGKDMSGYADWVICAQETMTVSAEDDMEMQSAAVLLGAYFAKRAYKLRKIVMAHCHEKKGADKLALPFAVVCELAIDDQR